MMTNRETVKILCGKVLTRLENRNAIALTSAESRTAAQDELLSKIGPDILTEEDLKERTLAEMGHTADMGVDPSFTESEQFKVARSMVRKQFGEDYLNGFYYQKSLRDVAKDVIDYLMDSSLIEDVFESDDDLLMMIIDTIRKFRPDQLH